MLLESASGTITLPNGKQKPGQEREDAASLRSAHPATSSSMFMKSRAYYVFFFLFSFQKLFVCMEKVCAPGPLWIWIWSCGKNRKIETLFAVQHALDVALAFWTVHRLPRLQNGLLWLRPMILVCAKEGVRRMTGCELE